ncbi:hypothetical protein RMB12_14610 [Acinetobacter sp. V117_2]|nr:hypothetical protein [Acinetobacter sp. V117_2]
MKSQIYMCMTSNVAGLIMITQTSMEKALSANLAKHFLKESDSLFLKETTLLVYIANVPQI